MTENHDSGTIRCDMNSRVKDRFAEVPLRGLLEQRFAWNSKKADLSPRSLTVDHNRDCYCHRRQSWNRCCDCHPMFPGRRQGLITYLPGI